jgi:hypothetical protein
MPCIENLPMHEPVMRPDAMAPISRPVNGLILTIADPVLRR